MNLTWFSLLPVVLALTAGGGGPALGPQQEAAPAGEAGGTIDPAVCAGCHDQAVFANFDRTAHARTTQTCASCHGDPATLMQHAETGDPELVRRFTRMKPQEASQTCLTCHEKGSQAAWHGSIHDRRKVGCTSCHSVHHFKSMNKQIKTVREAETCYSCHPAVRALAQRTSHHPIREGKMDCSSCHNPHGTAAARLIKADSINEQCYSCHTEKRGPFLWEHAPVRENCTNCHNAHGSNHDNLLVAKQPYLCQRCHLNTRHPGTLYDLTNTTFGASPSNRAVEHGCRNCHQQVHGTNHPSGPYLGR
jgi:DmsE family decaheme c-type cytochrome